MTLHLKCWIPVSSWIKYRIQLVVERWRNFDDHYLEYEEAVVINDYPNLGCLNLTKNMDEGSSVNKFWFTAMTLLSSRNILTVLLLHFRIHVLHLVYHFDISLSNNFYRVITTDVCKYKLILRIRTRKNSFIQYISFLWLFYK